MSIAELKDITDRYAAWFLAHSITPMDPVAVYCRENVQYLIQYIALTAIGAVPVLTNGTMRADVATQHFRRIGVVGIVTDRDHRAALAPYFGNGDLKLLHTLEDIPEDVPSDLPPWFPFEHDHHHPVMITHSSGTTGDPKPIVLEHGTWFYGIRQLLGLDTAQGADRYLSSLPTSHNASIAYAMHAILNGAALMIMADHSGVSVARTIERFRPATVVSFPQTFVDLAALDLDGFDLNSVTTWINSGDAAHEAHIRRLVAHGFHYRGDQRVPGSQFVDGLGSSEMGHSSFRIIHTPYTDSYDRCVGIPQSWVEATVFDSGGQPAPIGVIGRLGIHSPSVTAGYWNDSLLTYKSRRHGYWLTGDLAYRDRLGCYYHVDRVSDVIPTRDGPLYSLQTEELILKHQGSRLVDCTVIGVTEEGTDAGTQVPVVLAVPRTGCSVDTAALLNEINQAQACKNRPSLAQAYFVDWSEVPLGVTGKVLKRTLREQFESGARRLERTSRLGAGTRG
jgi:acyl-coenzyme A synthetase/AMP-(fatty) acid ligase